MFIEHRADNAVNTKLATLSVFISMLQSFKNCDPRHQPALIVMLHVVHVCTQHTIIIIIYAGVLI